MTSASILLLNRKRNSRTPPDVRPYAPARAAIRIERKQYLDIASTKATQKEELTKVADESRQALSATNSRPEAGTDEHRESGEALRARIAKEVRESFTQHELGEWNKLWRAGEKRQP